MLGRYAFTLPETVARASRAADDLIETLLAKHDAIRPAAFTGAGLRLPRQDSAIAEGVMRRMRRQGIAVPPVHDSFLVSASKADLLAQAMIDEAARRGAAVDCRRSLSGSPPWAKSAPHRLCCKLGLFETEGFRAGRGSGSEGS